MGLKKKPKILERAANHRRDFFDFLQKYNVIDVAIGIVIGGALKDLVNSLVADIIMPIVGIIAPNGSWRLIAFKIGGSEFQIGNLAANLLNFLIIALIVYIVIKKILKIENANDKKNK